MIRNIIFDIGNVLMEYDWLLPFKNFGLSHEESMRLYLLMNDEIWRKMDLGLLDEDGAKKEYRAKYPADADAMDYFIDHMEIIRVDRPAVWEKLPKLREKGYRLYYLSNYPEQLFAVHMGDAAFMREMDGGVVSYEVHLGKPDAKIYEHLLEKYDLKAEESLFFDDRPENTEAAERLGMRGTVIASQAQLLAELEKLI